jgi:carbon-monoxide dehydrogenase medium subunit
MAGGTDVLVKIKKGGLRPLLVIDMKGIPGMEGFSISRDRFSIGALTRIRTLETSSEVKRKLPLLAQAAGKLGSVQVRNKATLGGNLCNAAPSAETAPALLAMEARAEIYGTEGLRVVDLREFFKGPGLTVLKQGEILTALEIPLNGQKRQGAVYYKLANRAAMDIAFVGVAVLLQIDEHDRISKGRIALGAVAPTPIRAGSAEKLLEGKVLDGDTLLESAELTAEACSPISDLRASAEYRRAMVKQLCQRGLLEAYNLAKSSKGDENS